MKSILVYILLYSFLHELTNSMVKWLPAYAKYSNMCSLCHSNTKSNVWINYVSIIIKCHTFNWFRSSKKFDDKVVTHHSADPPATSLSCFISIRFTSCHLVCTYVTMITWSVHVDLQLMNVLYTTHPNIPWSHQCGNCLWCPSTKMIYKKMYQN